MISSKEHFGCMGEVFEEFNDELQSLIEKTKNLFSDGNLTIYEHGRAGSCMISDSGNSCHHFHLHFLPVATNFYDELELKYKHKTLNNYGDIYDYCSRYGDYILYQSGDKIKFFYTEDKDVPSHFVRTLMSRHLNEPEIADWEGYNSADLLNKNYEEMETLRKMMAQ